MSDDLTIPQPVYRPGHRPRHGMEPATRRLLIIAASLAGGLVAIFAASGLTHRHPGEIPVVQADNRPIRVKPENPGGLQVANANNEIFSGGDDTDASKLAPGPERPDPNALRVPDPPATPGEGTVQPLLPGQMQAQPGTQAPVQSQAATRTPTGSSTGIPAAPAALESPAPVLLAPPPPPLTAAKVRSTNAGQATGGAASGGQASGGKVSGGKVSGGKANQTQVAIAAPATHIATPEVARTQVTGADRHMAPVAGGKGAVVQLAALGSEDAARAEWQFLEKRMPELLGGRQPTFSRTEHDGHTFWRVRTAGFADLAQAHAFCDHVRAKGGSCSVADF